MSGFSELPGASGAAALSVALIGPQEQCRRAVAGVLGGCQDVLIREFSSYPASIEDIPSMLEGHYDVVIVDVDSNPKLALHIVEGLCDDLSRTVMVYSVQADREQMVQCMRAGAREFFTLPIDIADMAHALARVSVRRPGAAPVKRCAGRLFTFCGAKGGCGVTTLASNFAISLAQESGEKALLIDLGLPLGDVAINLGIVTEFSTENAFQNSNRLDMNFLSSLLATHSSGLSVLAAPGEIQRTEVSVAGIDKLVAVARQNFDYIVVDAGSRLDLMASALFDVSANIYLVTQVGLSELRNANRLISRFFANSGSSLQIVLNRYAPLTLLFGEDHITKALTRPAQWRIPDDFASARRTRNTSIPLAMEDSPISNAVREMARKACGSTGKLEKPEKKKGFSIFGRSR